MRVSTSMIFSQGLANLQQQQTSILQSQKEIATGVRLTSSSQDPVSFAAASRLSNQDSQLNQYQRNIDAATGKVQLQESTLGSVTNMLQRVRGIAIQANNGAQSGTSRQALVDELNQLKTSIASQANATNERGEYMFSGTAAHIQPYIKDATGQYVINPKLDVNNPPATGYANPKPVNLQISDGRSVEVNRTPQGIFSISAGSSSTGSEQSVMQVIDRLSSAIQTQPANVQTVYQQTQQDLDTIMNQVTDGRGRMGNTLNVLSQTKDDNAVASVANQKTLSNLRDTDMASAITKLNQSYQNLQATQQSMVKIQGLSLFNYLS